MSKEPIHLSGSIILNEAEDAILLLFRDDHKHYETPGGKVEANECKDFSSPTKKELEHTAMRELVEELGSDFLFEELDYFTTVSFNIPDGRSAIAHKFFTRVLFGIPRINEPNTFSRLEYVKILELENTSVSADLRLLLPALKERFL